MAQKRSPRRTAQPKYLAEATGKRPRTKKRSKTGEKLTRDAATGRFVLAQTKDGVRILKPKGRATHFTTRELRDAITTVRTSRKG
jgi:hypothetical protein